MLNLQPDEVAIFEPDGGVLKHERAIAAQLAVAERHGAIAHFAVAMWRWEPTDDGFDVLLADGTCVAARALILALGRWVQRSLADVGVSIRVQRNVQAWFAGSTNDCAAPWFPRASRPAVDAASPSAPQSEEAQPRQLARVQLLSGVREEESQHFGAHDREQPRSSV
jgi:glycine/D-amino acid oxidase-like deaminating enzyme